MNFKVLQRRGQQPAPGAPGPDAAGQAAAARPALWRELVLGIALFAVYLVVAAMDWPGRERAAARHARSIYDAERYLHIDVERSLNSWLVRHALLRTLADYEYAFTYVLSAFLLLGWLYLRRPAIYRWARRSFVVLNLLGIACFALYPLTPPRLMPALGYVDTVSNGHTWGSWGSGVVDHANELAAMPSLHLAWALWVSLVLKLIAGNRRTQLVSLIHVLVTLLVILATANHYVLDAVVAVLLVWLSPRLAGRTGAADRSGGQRVAAADAFFLHVESPAAAQHVGGLVLLDRTGRPASTPSREQLVEILRGQLGQLPRFGQRLSAISRWRRPRWLPAGELDWDWHVPAFDLHTADGRPGGLDALRALVAELQSVPLRRDRPLWRMAVVHGVTEHQSAAVLLVHHVVADGFGTVAQALRLLEPRLPPATGPEPGGPGPLARAVATVAGIGQLATDGRPGRRIGSLTDPGRSFGTVTLPLAEVRAVARAHRARVSDVLLCLVAGGLAGVLGEQRSRQLAELRTSVPLMVRDPRSAVEGNVTAAVMLDLPLASRTEPDRLAEIARRSGRLRGGTRALASRFVMVAVGELFPPVLHGWFARSVYGWRYFQAIVSNMPGPDRQLSLAGLPIQSAFPILPLAPGAPIAVGALGWHGQLCIGVSADPQLVPDQAELAAAITAAFAALAAAGRPPDPIPGPGAGAVSLRDR